MKEASSESLDYVVAIKNLTQAHKDDNKDIYNKLLSEIENKINNLPAIEDQIALYMLLIKTAWLMRNATITESFCSLLKALYEEKCYDTKLENSMSILIAETIMKLNNYYSNETLLKLLSLPTTANSNNLKKKRKNNKREFLKKEFSENRFLRSHARTGSQSGSRSDSKSNYEPKNELGSRASRSYSFTKDSLTVLNNTLWKEPIEKLTAISPRKNDRFSLDIEDINSWSISIIQDIQEAFENNNNQEFIRLFNYLIKKTTRKHPYLRIKDYSGFIKNNPNVHPDILIKLYAELIKTYRKYFIATNQEIITLQRIKKLLDSLRKTMPLKNFEYFSKACCDLLNSEKSDDDIITILNTIFTKNITILNKKNNAFDKEYVKTLLGDIFTQQLNEWIAFKNINQPCTPRIALTLLKEIAERTISSRSPISLSYQKLFIKLSTSKNTELKKLVPPFFNGVMYLMGSCNNLHLQNLFKFAASRLDDDEAKATRKIMRSLTKPLRYILGAYALYKNWFNPFSISCDSNLVCYTLLDNQIITVTNTGEISLYKNNKEKEKSCIKKPQQKSKKTPFCLCKKSDLMKLTKENNIEKIVVLKARSIPPTRCFTAGRKLILGRESGKIIIENYEHKTAKKLLGHSRKITGLLLLNPFTEHEFLVSGSFDKTIRIWNLENESCIQTIHCTGKVQGLAKIDPNITISLTHKRFLTVWNTTNMVDIKDSAHKNYKKTTVSVINTIEESENITAMVGAGPYLITGSFDGKLKVWNPKNGICLFMISQPLPIIGLSRDAKNNMIMLLKDNETNKKKLILFTKASQLFKN